MKNSLCTVWKNLCQIDFNFYESKSRKKMKIPLGELNKVILREIGKPEGGGCVVVNGGHYLPNTETPQKIGKNPLATWDAACGLTLLLKEKGFDAKISLMTNDVGLPAETRKELTLNVPLPYTKTMQKYGLKASDLMNYSNKPKEVYSEKKLANRYIHQKQKKKWNLYKKGEVDNYCSAAFIPYFRDVVKQGADFSVWVMCKCASQNLIKAIELFSDREGGLRNICYFYTNNCFE